jgi:hypothetical protein
MIVDLRRFPRDVRAATSGDRAREYSRTLIRDPGLGSIPDHRRPPQ